MQIPSGSQTNIDAAQQLPEKPSHVVLFPLEEGDLQHLFDEQPDQAILDSKEEELQHSSMPNQATSPDTPAQQANQTSQSLDQEAVQATAAELEAAGTSHGNLGAASDAESAQQAGVPLQQADPTSSVRAVRSPAVDLRGAPSLQLGQAMPVYSGGTQLEAGNLQQQQQLADDVGQLADAIHSGQMSCAQQERPASGQDHSMQEPDQALAAQSRGAQMRGGGVADGHSQGVSAVGRANAAGVSGHMSVAEDTGAGASSPVVSACSCLLYCSQGFALPVKTCMCTVMALKHFSMLCSRAVMCGLVERCLL